MLNVCITFDYELFLGKNNAPYQEILFQPTKRIIDALAKAETSGTFFADVCSVEAHHRLGDGNYCDAFTAQIVDMVKYGQDVQLHLHTNWLSAEKIKGQIIPGQRGYRIQEFDFDTNSNTSEIVRKGKMYLEDVCHSRNKNYRCIAYRAGGFAVQPEEKLFKVLIDNDILIDSSIVPHMKADGINHYDYTRVPNKINWWIDPEKGLNKEGTAYCNSIFEVPIATATPRLWQVIGKPKNQLSLPSHRILGEYVTSQASSPKMNPLIRQWHRLFDYRYVSLDTRYYQRVIEDLEYIYRHFGLEDCDGYVCLICHPKIADQSRIDNISNLVAELKKRKTQFALVNFTDIYNKIFN